MKTVLLFYIFLALPFFDMLNGILIGQGELSPGALASPSQIGRFVGLGLLLVCSAVFKHSPYMISSFIVLVLLETMASFRYDDISGLAYGYLSIGRFLYIYLAYICFTRYFGDDVKPLIRFLKYNIIILCLSVIVASFTGLANSTYGWGAGTKGFFASGNGLGIYVGVATLILAAMKKYGIYRDIHVGVFALSAYTLVSLGTKTSFLMFVLVLFAGFWSSRIRVFIIPALIFGTIQFLNQISEGLIARFDIILLRYKNSRSLSEYLFSNRDVYAETAWADFISQHPDFLRWVFGGGAFLSFQNPRLVKSFDTLETDFFDVFFMYGVVGLACYSACLLFSTRPFLRSPWMLVPAVLLWTHSVVAGHVLFNGLGATLVVVVLAIGARFEEYKNGGNLANGGSSGRRIGFKR